MSLHYILDGYNIIHQMPALVSKNLEQQRNGFIHGLESCRPQGSSNNKITVVFDGKAGIIGRMESAIVKIIFSKDETADEKIKRLVEESRNAKNIIVVTNDRSIQYSVRANGAGILSVKEFLSRMNLWRRI